MRRWVSVWVATYWTVMSITTIIFSARNDPLFSGQCSELVWEFQEARTWWRSMPHENAYSFFICYRDFVTDFVHGHSLSSEW